MATQIAASLVRPNHSPAPMNTSTPRADGANRRWNHRAVIKSYSGPPNGIRSSKRTTRSHNTSPLRQSGLPSLVSPDVR